MYTYYGLIIVMAVVAFLSLALNAIVLLWVEKMFVFPRPTFWFAIVTVLVTNAVGVGVEQAAHLVGLPASLLLGIIASVSIFWWLLRKQFSLSSLRIISVFVVSTSVNIILVILIALIVRTFIVSPFVVSGDAMVPTYPNGTYLIANELSHNFTRGDVVVLREHGASAQAFLIKRVVGLPEESVEIHGGRVSVNGSALHESYASGSTTPDSITILGSNEYFVLGDNRASSTDSRAFGPILKSDIIGKIILNL